MYIGNVQLKNNIVFAPVAGFSDVGFRHLCAKFGAGMTYTELVSAKGLVYGSKGTDELLATTDIQKPCAVQLFGSDPEFMYRAAADERLKKFDIIDINMGCPVKKVFNNGEGSALMRDPQLVKEIVQAVMDGSQKPVTVKMRAGIVEGDDLAVGCALAAQEGGACAVTVHPRYREQYYSGRADHTVTAAVKRALAIPVIANGDIVDAASLQEVSNTSGADGFMIARGALGRPYIFGVLSGSEPEYCVKRLILEHMEILRRFYKPQTVANQMKLHLCYYAKGEPFAKSVRSAIASAKTIDDIYAIVDNYFIESDTCI